MLLHYTLQLPLLLSLWPTRLSKPFSCVLLLRQIFRPSCTRFFYFSYIFPDRRFFPRTDFKHEAGSRVTEKMNQKSVLYTTITTTTTKEKNHCEFTITMLFLCSRFDIHSRVSGAKDWVCPFRGPPSWRLKADNGRQVVGVWQRSICMRKTGNRFFPPSPNGIVDYREEFMKTNTMFLSQMLSTKAGILVYLLISGSAILCLWYESHNLTVAAG